jgi:hypothetical protein
MVAWVDQKPIVSSFERGSRLYAWYKRPWNNTKSKLRYFVHARSVHDHFIHKNIIYLHAQLESFIEEGFSCHCFLEAQYSNQNSPSEQLFLYRSQPPCTSSTSYVPPNILPSGIWPTDKSKPNVTIIEGFSGRIDKLCSGTKLPSLE